MSPTKHINCKIGLNDNFTLKQDKVLKKAKIPLKVDKKSNFIGRLI